MADEGMPIGALIRLHRINRKQSVVQLATHAGITTRYLEMIEAGGKTPSLPTLRKIAQVLELRTSALVGTLPSEAHEGPLLPRLAEIERALFTYRTFGLTNRPTPDVSDLALRVSVALDAWFTSTSKYSEVLTVLPDLIVDAELAVSSTGYSTLACRAAYGVYRLLRSVVKHVGRVDLCGLVADRAMHYAERTDDPLLVGAATWNLTQMMLSDDMPHAALEVATQGAERLEPMLTDGDADHFAVFGALVLIQAISSVRTGDPWRARELLRGPARRAAARVRDGNSAYGLFFGPTNVAIHRVSVEHEVGELSDAIRLADEVDASAIPSLERQTTHLYQVARCYEQKGNDTAVLVHLRMAERLCPDEFRFKRGVRDMVGSLAHRARPTFAAEVRDFARHIGMLDES
jgi:transcriptional regulator with XRE-family HTH domain